MHWRARLRLRMSTKKVKRIAYEEHEEGETNRLRSDTRLALARAASEPHRLRKGGGRLAPC
jgi:hypothetical protein